MMDFDPSVAIVIAIAFTTIVSVTIWSLIRAKPSLISSKGRLPALDETDIRNYHAGTDDDVFRSSEDPLGGYRERITMVSVRHPSGTLYWAEAPLRHHSVINNFMDRLGVAGSANVSGDKQGFITSHGRVVSREEAMVVARAARQIVTPPTRLNHLYSEDLWF